MEPRKIIEQYQALAKKKQVRLEISGNATSYGQKSYPTILRMTFETIFLARGLKHISMLHEMKNKQIFVKFLFNGTLNEKLLSEYVVKVQKVLVNKTGYVNYRVNPKVIEIEFAIHI